MILDLSYLETISGGDKAFINEMLNMFLSSTFPEFENLQQYARQKAWAEVGSTAHKMKAPIQMLGVPEVSALILEIEMLGKHQKDLDKADEKIALLGTYLRDMEIAIKAIINA